MVWVPMCNLREEDFHRIVYRSGLHWRDGKVYHTLTRHVLSQAEIDEIMSLPPDPERDPNEDFAAFFATGDSEPLNFDVNEIFAEVEAEEQERLRNAPPQNDQNGEGKPPADAA